MIDIIIILYLPQSFSCYCFVKSNNNGWTPIHLAAKNGHLAALEVLLQHCQKEACEIIDNQHVSIKLSFLVI